MTENDQSEYAAYNCCICGRYNLRIVHTAVKLYFNVTHRVILSVHVCLQIWNQHGRASAIFTQMIARLLEVSAGRSEKQQQNKHTMTEVAVFFYYHLPCR